MSKIKAVGNLVLDVLAVPFGDPDDLDLDGEYFSKDTDLHLDKFTDPLILYWHGRDVGGSEQQKAEVIGESLGHTIKPDGVWIKVQLDKANKFARRVWDAARRGVAAASSGTVAHLMRKAADGFIADWPLIELSLFDVDHSKNRLPVNKNAIALPAAKALYSQAGRSFPELPTEEYISDAETKALQKKAFDMLVDDGVDKALTDREFGREPTEEEQLYEAAAVGIMNHFQNNERVKSCPVRIASHMTSSKRAGAGKCVVGSFTNLESSGPQIMLKAGLPPKDEYRVFLHEVGHFLDEMIRGEVEYYKTSYCIKSTAREDQADEYREILGWFAFDQARRQFYGGKLSVKSIPINKLLEALS